MRSAGGGQDTGIAREAGEAVQRAGADGLVTLDGTVRSWAERRQAEHAAFAAPGLTGVTNQLHIER